MKLALENKIRLGFGLALLVLSVIGLTSYVSIKWLVEIDEWQEQTYLTLVKLEMVLSDLKDVGGGGYVITGDESYLQPYYTAIKQIDQDVEALRQLTAADPQLQQHLELLEPLIRRRLAIAKQLINTRQSEGFEVAAQLVQTDEGKRVMDAIRREIGQIKNEKTADLQQQEAVAEAEVHRVTMVVSVGSLLAIIIVFIAIFVINNDITQRRQLEAALQGSEMRYSSLFKGNHAVMLLLDPETGNIVDANPAACAFYGYSHAEITHMKITDINQTPPEQVAQIMQEVKLAQRKNYNFKYRLANGAIVDVEVHTGPIKLGGRDLLCSIAYDITERRRLETSLQESEGLFRATFEEAPIGIVLTDMQGGLLTANLALQKMLGYSLTDLQQMNITELTHPDDVNQTMKLHQELSCGERQSYQLEKRYLRQDGQVVWGRGTASQVRDDQGWPLFNLGMIENITARKQTEEKLRLTHLAVENSPAIIFRWRYDMAAGWPVEFVSRNVSQLGYTAEEFLAKNMPYTSIMVSEDVDQINREIETYFANGIDRYRLEYRLITKEGQVRWVDDRTVVERDAEGHVIYSQGLILDITERKQAEETLRQSEERFALAVGGANDGIWDWDIVNDTLYWSPHLIELYGYNPAEFSPSLEKFEASLHPDEKETVKAAIEAHLNHHMPYDLEMRGQTQAGEYRWFRVRGQAVWNETGRPMRMVGSATDITERRQAEEELRQAEAKYRLLIEQIPLAVHTSALDDLSSTLYISPQIETMVGYSPEEWLADPELWSKLLHPDDRDRALAANAHTNATGDPLRLEYRLLTKEGQVVWVREETLVVANEVGQPLFQQGIFLDITERKQAEKALAEERNLLRTLIDNLPDSIYVKDTAGRHLIINRTAAQGVATVEEMLGKTDLDLYSPEMAQQWYADDMAVIQSGQPIINREEPALDAAGGIVGWDLTTKVPLYDSHGQVIGLVGVTRDITEQKYAEKAVLENEALLRTVINATPDWIFIKDQEHRLRLINQSYADALQLSAEACLGKNELELGFPEEIVKGNAEKGIRGFWTSDREVLDMGESRLIPEASVVVDGQLIIQNTVKVPLRDGAGKVWGVLGFTHDITELKRVQEELLRAKDAAESATRVKSEFLANMSHEIRTPLNAIIGMTSLLLDTSLSSEQQDFAETIRTSGDTLLTIINDILDFSKIEAGKLDLEKQPFDLRQCIEESLDLVAMKAAEKNLDLAYSMGEFAPHILIGDVTRLRQILVNLLNNAVKFTEQGEVILSVRSQPLKRATTEQQTGHLEGGQTIPEFHQVHFSVRDTGLGIPADRMDRLFRSFSQVDTSTTRKYGGTGLGLTISKRLSEMMGGEMWVESSGIPGEGSTFHFSILAEATSNQLSISLYSEQAKLVGKQLLIVDDNATNRFILARQAQAWGMQPRAAVSSQEALAWLGRGDHFDLAILDMQMPEMDGLMLATEIRRLEESRETAPTKGLAQVQESKGEIHSQIQSQRPPMGNLKSKVPLVMLTSLGQREHHDQNAQAELAAFLTKPIKPSHLYNVLVAVFEGQPIKIKPDSVRSSSLDRELGQRHPLRILLAEDNVVNQKVALHLLERMGYRADIAANGLEVLQALQRQPYEVVLMDMQMPEMDGLEATRFIYKNWSVEQRPWIIAMTANALQGDRERCFEAGMNDYVSKPVRPEELAQALARCQLHSEPIEAEIGAVQWLGGVEKKRTENEPQLDSVTSVLESSVLTELRELLGDQAPQMITELINVYFETAPPLLEEMRMAIKQEDGHALYRAAHTLKPGSAHMGAVRLARMCAELERMGKANQLKGAVIKLAEFEAEFAHVRVALEAEKRGSYN